MTTHQLRRLDQALVALIDERVRLLDGGDDALRRPSREDVLRRYDGPLPPASLSAVLDAIDRACAEARAGRVTR